MVREKLSGSFRKEKSLWQIGIQRHQSISMYITHFGTLTELITEYTSSNLVNTKGTERMVQGSLAFKKSKGKKRKGKLITLIAVIRIFSLIEAVGLPTFSLECIEGTSGHTLLWKPYTVAETCSQHAVTMLG